MNQVDFLPESYIQNLIRKRRIARQILIIVLVITGLAAWGVMLRTGIASKQNRAQALEQEVQIARETNTVINQLRNEYGQLTHQVKIQRELSLPVQHTRVIATIAQLLPPQIALTELSIRTHRRQPTKIIPEGATKSRKRMRAEAEAAAAGTADQEKLEIEVEALSPDAASVASLIETLSTHPLITDVHMRYTRAVEMQGVIAREFRMELEIALDREFVAPEQAKEVAHAD